MLDALIYGQDREIARPGEPPVIKERLQSAQDRRIAITVRPDAINEIRAGRMDLVFRDCLRSMVEQRACAVSQQFLYLLERCAGAFEFGSHLMTPPEMKNKQALCLTTTGSSEARIITQWSKHN